MRVSEHFDLQKKQPSLDFVDVSDDSTLYPILRVQNGGPEMLKVF